MSNAVEFPFSDDEALPMIPITLSHAGSSISANAVLDTRSPAIAAHDRNYSLLIRVDVSICFGCDPALGLCCERKLMLGFLPLTQPTAVNFDV